MQEKFKKILAKSTRFISLRIRLLLGFTVVYSLIFVATYSWFYRYSTDQAMQRIENDLVDTLKGTAAGINAEEFEVLAQLPVPAGEILPLDHPLYQKHQTWLQTVNQIEPRAIPYTFIAGQQPYEVLFIGDYLRIARPESPTSFRESYLAEPSKTRLYQGLTRIAITLTPYNDQWGNWVSAYGPILNRQGKSVGGIGIDFRADYVLEVQQGIRQNLAIAFSLTYITLFLLVYLLANIVTNPLTKLAMATEQISAGSYHPTLSHLRKRKIQDEISTLAALFEQMVNKIRQREEMLQEYSQALEEEVQQRTQELQTKNTELEQALRYLQQTQAQLVHSEKMSSLGQLVAGVAHEINNPVNFIQGNLAPLQTEVQDLLHLIQLYQHYFPEATPEIQAEAERVDLEFLQTDLPKMLSSIRLGTERISKIVVNLRNFSRMDEAEFKEVNIHEGLDSTLLILQHRLVGKGNRAEIKVIKEYGHLPLVECYPGQLNQVFMNLLVNAIDAIEDKDPQSEFQPTQNPVKQITVRTAVVDSDWVQIAIADNGVGIPPEIQSRIFNPFFTTKPIGKGTGMGMSISYQIVTQKHGGTLEFTSEQGQGTEFIVQIPIRQPPS